MAWLFGIARNVVADEFRRKAKELRTDAHIRGRELVDEDDLAALHGRNRDRRLVSASRSCDDGKPRLQHARIRRTTGRLVRRELQVERHIEQDAYVVDALFSWDI